MPFKTADHLVGQMVVSTSAYTPGPGEEIDMLHLEVVCFNPSTRVYYTGCRDHKSLCNSGSILSSAPGMLSEIITGTAGVTASSAGVPESVTYETTIVVNTRKWPLALKVDL